MAVIDVPETIGFDGCTITLVRATAEHRSPFTGRRQVVVSAFALWKFEGQVVPLQGVEAGAVRSFLAQLRGRANTFRLPVPAAGVPLSGYQGTAGTVDGAGHTGYTLPGKGWTPGAVLLRQGDYFNIGDELKVATQDIQVDGAGKAVLFFEPALRNSPADNAPIRLSDPFLYLAAQDDEVASWGLKDYNTHSMKIEALEAFE